MLRGKEGKGGAVTLGATRSGARLFHQRGLLAGVSVATLVIASAGARAGVLVNDTWLDGTRTDPVAPTYSENGTDADNDGNIESAWFQGGIGTLAPVGPGGPLRGDLGLATGTSSATYNTYFTPESGQVSLSQGESVKVTWTFTPHTVNTSNTSQNFRVALVGTPVGSRLSGDGTMASAAYTGYAMFMNMGQTLGNSSPFRLERRNVASGDILGTSGNWAAVGTTGATSGNHGFDDGTSYTLTMQLTRTLADALDIQATMTGGTLNNSGTESVSFTDTTPSGFTYDNFVVRPSGAASTAAQFDTTLFKAEYASIPSVPEPAGLAAVGLGGLAFLRRRARVTRA